MGFRWPRTLEEIQEQKGKILRHAGEKKEIMCNRAYWDLRRLKDGNRGEGNGDTRQANSGR